MRDEPSTDRSARRLGGAVAVLVGLDVVGGAVAIVDGINTAQQAWGPEARLAAPWPMVLAQVVLTVVATGTRRRPVTVAAALLAAACLVSAVSGFFDGGLADERLAGRHRVLQAVLLAWTALVSGLAVHRVRQAARGAVRNG